MPIRFIVPDGSEALESFYAVDPTIKPGNYGRCATHHQEQPWRTGAFAGRYASLFPGCFINDGGAAAVMDPNGGIWIGWEHVGGLTIPGGPAVGCVVWWMKVARPQNYVAVQTNRVDPTRLRPRVTPMSNPELTPVLGAKREPVVPRMNAPVTELQPLLPAPPRITYRLPPSLVAPEPAPGRPNERKARGPRWLVGAFVWALRIYEGYTEVIDFVDAVFAALPKKIRDAIPRDASDFEKIKAVLDHMDSVDVDKAVNNVIANQIEDFIIGQGYRGRSKLVERLRANGWEEGQIFKFYESLRVGEAEAIRIAAEVIGDLMPTQYGD